MPVHIQGLCLTLVWIIFSKQRGVCSYKIDGTRHKFHTRADWYFAARRIMADSQLKRGTSSITICGNSSRPLSANRAGIPGCLVIHQKRGHDSAQAVNTMYGSTMSWGSSHQANKPAKAAARALSRTIMWLPNIIVGTVSVWASTIPPNPPHIPEKNIFTSIEAETSTRYTPFSLW